MTATPIDTDQLLVIAADLDRRAVELARRLATAHDAGRMPDQQDQAEHDYTRAMARRLKLAAFVLDAAPLVANIRTELGLLAERHSQALTGRLVGELERERLEHVMAHVHTLRFEVGEHWDHLVNRAHELAADATESDSSGVPS